MPLSTSAIYCRIVIIISLALVTLSFPLYVNPAFIKEDIIQNQISST